MEELLASLANKQISLSRGQQIEGEIVAITDKELVLDLGTKAEGVLPIRDLSLAQAKDLKVGDKLTTYVETPENEAGQVILSLVLKLPEKKSSYGERLTPQWSKLMQAQSQQSLITASVIEFNKGGLIVEVEGLRGFLPSSHLGYEALKLSDLVGGTLKVTVLEIDKANNRLIFTQKSPMDEGTKKLFDAIKIGSQVKGKVKFSLPFGLIVELNGGLGGLIPISEVSWEKIDDLSNFKEDSEVEAKVIGKDEESGRINLSIKALLEDPFSKLSQEYKVDEVIKGEVSNVSPSGVVVKLKDNIEGYLPTSKMGKVDFEVGKPMNFLVDSVDNVRRRVNLAPFVTSTSGLIYK